MITLEICSTDIRVMEIDGGKITKWASMPFAPGTFDQESISDQAAFTTAVRQLMNSAGIKGKNVTASVSGLYSLSRIVLVPTPPGANLTSQAVLDAAAEVLPVAEEAIYISWQAIGSGQGGQQALTISVPRETIDKEVQALRASGVNPRIIDLKTMALIRAVNKEQALILNVESASFDTALVVNGIAEAIRTTAWEPQGLSTEEIVERLAAALERTVAFYDSHHPEFRLTPGNIPFFVTGKMSTNNDLITGLQNRLEFPFEQFKPPVEYPPHLPVSQFAVNIGLALKGREAPAAGQSGFSLPDINLLPQIYLPWKPTRLQIGIVLAALAGIMVLAPLYTMTTQAMSKTANLQSKYTIMNKEMEKRKLELAKRDPLQIAINQYSQIIAMGGGFVDDLTVIRTEAEKLGIKVKSISHSGSSISFECQADSFVTFREYLTALKDSGKFTSVSSPAERFPYLTGGAITITLKH